MSKEIQKRNLNIDLIKGLAVFLVVLVHFFNRTNFTIKITVYTFCNLYLECCNGMCTVIFNYDWLFNEKCQIQQEIFHEFIESGWILCRGGYGFNDHR